MMKNCFSNLLLVIAFLALAYFALMHFNPDINKDQSFLADLEIAPFSKILEGNFNLSDFQDYFNFNLDKLEFFPKFIEAIGGFTNLVKDLSSDIDLKSFMPTK